MKNQELRTPDSAESASALSPREALNVAHEKELLILKKLPPRIRTADDVQALAGILNDFNEAVTSKREAAKQLPSDKVLQQSLEFQTAFYDEVFEAISASWQETEMEMKPSSEKCGILICFRGGSGTYSRAKCFLRLWRTSKCPSVCKKTEMDVPLKFRETSFPTKSIILCGNGRRGDTAPHRGCGGKGRKFLEGFPTIKSCVRTSYRAFPPAGAFRHTSRTLKTGMCNTPPVSVVYSANVCF